MITATEMDMGPLLATLFPPGVAAYYSHTLPADAKLLATESNCIGNMVEKRRMEFTHGRHCAHQAMTLLGMSAVAIPKGTDRAPVWPNGIVGSISHCNKSAAAVVARSSELGGVGLDLESPEALSHEIIEMVCRPDERKRIGNDGNRAKLLFSIKEAVYKCIYPRVGCYVDFQEMEIFLDEADTSFSARSHSRNFDAQLIDGLQGRYHKNQEIIMTSAWLTRPD